MSRLKRIGKDVLRGMDYLTGYDPQKEKEKKLDATLDRKLSEQIALRERELRIKKKQAQLKKLQEELKE